MLESELGIAAARSKIYQFAGRTFLEVVRFDRHGVSGRSPVCTLQSLNAALLGMASSSWAKVATQMLKGTSKNPNSVAILRCSKNFNAYISYICGALKFFSRLVSLRILNF